MRIIKERKRLPIASQGGQNSQFLIERDRTERTRILSYMYVAFGCYNKVVPYNEHPYMVSPLIGRMMMLNALIIFRGCLTNV